LGVAEGEALVQLQSIRADRQALPFSESKLQRFGQMVR
jgi:hypothetical protein